MRRFIVLLLSCAFYLILPLNSIQGQEDFGYAYLAASDWTEAEIIIIDPANPTTPLSVIPFEVPPEYVAAPYRAYVSPDGRWMGAFIWSNRRLPFIFRLVNLLTGETRDVLSGSAALDQAVNAVAPRQQLVSWSFDSRYVAFNMGVSPQDDIFVHDVQTNTTSNVTNATHEQIDVVWTPSTLRFVTTSLACQNEICDYFLSVYALNGTLEQSINLSDAFPDFLFTPCELRWSPDERYIGFVASCEADAGLPADAYIWDTASSTISTVTSFTTLLYGTRGILSGIYDLTWPNSQRLLVGATYIDNSIADVNQTLVYRLPQGTATALTNDHSGDWVQNPVTGQLAYRNFTTDEITSQNVVVKIATFSNDALAVSTTLPSGCDLSWSPDGTTLAFSQRGENSQECYRPVHAISFYNQTTNQTYQIDVSQYEWAIPVGWAALPDITPPTVTISHAVPAPSTPTNVSPITFNVLFNESVTGFDATDITLSGGTDTVITVSGAIYTVSVSGMGSARKPPLTGWRRQRH
jgi:hypothetical protein